MTKQNKDATATSAGNTKIDKAKLRRADEKKAVHTCISMFKNGTTKRCSSSRRVVSWRPWVNVVPLVGWLKKHGFSVNRVLNEAFLDWVGGLGDEKLRLRARLYRLLDEERELRQTMRVVLRSGAFLDSYAAKLVTGDEKLSVKLGRKPLAGETEVQIVNRILAQREAVVKEICEIEGKLLPEAEYVLKEDRPRRRRSWSRRRDKKGNIERS